MVSQEHVGQQFGHFTPDQVDVLRAGDFPGSIGDKAARDRFNKYSLNGDSVRTSHREAGSPLAHLDQFTDKVKAAGKVEEPIDVVAHDDYYSIHDGHHRALAAHAAGLTLPYRVVRDNRGQ